VKNAFNKDTLISPGYSFVLERGFSRSEATLGELREVIEGEASKTSKPTFICIGKKQTDNIIITSIVNIAVPICCLGHDSTFLLRDTETNLTIGIGKVLKLKPY
jgi:translation elongation factor EF-1alpha